MILLTRLIGAALVVIGVVAYLVTGMESATALLPAFLGLPLLVLGIVAGAVERSRGVLIAAVVLAALGVLGTSMNVAELPALLTGDDVERPVAVITSTITAVLCLVHVIAGVRWLAANRRGG